MEIKIAICDDEEVISIQLETTIMKYLKQKGIPCQVDVFCSGEELCKEMEENDYDLLFLDIELPQMNGVQIGSYIRETLKNDVLQIAYISAKQEYAMELFEIRPIHFLIKPLQEEKVAKVLDTYIKLNGGKEDIFIYRIGYNHHKIEIFKIQYFVRETRKVKMHTSDGVVEFYGSLEKIYEQLKHYGFLFIHKSYMVNYRYMKKIAYDHVIMTDGERLSISQARSKDIREMYRKLEVG